jgi:hypothetical protein
LLIQPAPDGMAHDTARLARIAAAFLAKSSVMIAREHKTKGRDIDVRALVNEIDVIDGDAAIRLTGALDWPSGALLRVRVSATAEGSAKPPEVAKALGVWGTDDPRGSHALVARLGVVAITESRVKRAASPAQLAGDRPG